MRQCIRSVRVYVNHFAENGIVGYAKPNQRYECLSHTPLMPVASDQTSSMNDAISDEHDLSQRVDLATHTMRDLPVEMA